MGVVNLNSGSSAALSGFLSFVRSRTGLAGETAAARTAQSTVFQTIKNVTVGFHRLAIMDPTFHANQPYIIEDGERTIVFIGNGEIYNFKEYLLYYGKFRAGSTIPVYVLTPHAGCALWDHKELRTP
jgi:asparagine synthetase B (glutamine-hydrolysing)